MAERKRKRQSDHDFRGRSKAPVSARMDFNVKITMIPEADEWCPIIATTPGLVLPGPISFETFEKARTTTPVNLRGSKASTLESTEFLLHSSKHPTISYTGNEDIQEEKLLKHFVGVFDPRTGEVEVMEARKMTVRGLVQRDAKEEEEEREGEKQTNRALRNELGLAFGTKKSRRAIASLTENAINPAGAADSTSGQNSGVATPQAVDADAAAVLHSMSSTAKTMASREELQNDVDASKPRPKANLDASEVKDVYTIEALVGPDVMRSVFVKDWQEAITRSGGIESKSRYVAKVFPKVSKEGDVRKLKVLRYLSLLLEFHLALGKQSREGRKLPKREDLKKALGVQDNLVDRIMKKFGDGGGPMNQWHIDYLITHIAALALIVEDFEVDIYYLKEDLRLELKQMTQYFREIGCKVSALTEKEREMMAKMTKAESASHRLAKLKVPLEFPIVRRIKARR